jgi:hypothetical protein
MTDKRMLIVPAELVQVIDENRGDLSQAEFINFLIGSLLKERSEEPSNVSREEIKAIEQELKKLSTNNSKKYATQEELHLFEQDLKKLLKNFVDFFIGYGLELGKQSPISELEELTSKLGDLDSDLPPGGGKEVKIKYK